MLLSDISAGAGRASVPTREQPKGVQPPFRVKTSRSESPLFVVVPIEVTAFGRDESNNEREDKNKERRRSGSRNSHLPSAGNVSDRAGWWDYRHPGFFPLG